MDDTELYLMAESNPLAGRLREQLVALGLMPQTPEPLAHNVADDELPWGDEE